MHRRSVLWLALAALAAPARSIAQQVAQESAASRPAADAKVAADAKPALDAKSAFDAALANAKKNYRRVLITFSSGASATAQALDRALANDAKVKHDLMYEYDVVRVDLAAKDAAAGAALAKRYGVELAPDAPPQLLIVDAEGKAVARAPFDDARLRALLGANQATAPAADLLLGVALARAKAEHKNVFLHFGAPWCGWCRKLEDWMARPDVAALLEKDFVDLKIDVERSAGGADVLARMRKGGSSDGIPWFVFLDGDGTALATSDSPKGNTGFPAQPHEIAHFAEMLHKAKRSLSDADVEALRASLEKAREPNGR